MNPGEILRGNNRERDSNIPISLENFRKDCEEAEISRLFEEFCRQCLAYVSDIYELRQESLREHDLVNRSNLEDKDKSRNISHTAIKDQLQAIVRNLNLKGVDTGWARPMLGGQGFDRNKAGKFAIQLAVQIAKESERIYGTSANTGHL